MRQIVLDTETTGIEVSQDHRIIEIGGVEVIDRRLTGRHFHCYIHPEREIDTGAQEVHGISLEFLADKPVFHVIAKEFLAFVKGTELVIHNAPFDVGFINHEFSKLDNNFTKIQDYCGVVDTLAMARKMHPGQKNNLNALCKRYGVDNSSRQLHGALLDAEILADVYLLMTGGQVALGLQSDAEDSAADGGQIRRLNAKRPTTPTIMAANEELLAHDDLLQKIAKAGTKPVWLGDKEVNPS